MRRMRRMDCRYGDVLWARRHAVCLDWHRGYDYHETREKSLRMVSVVVERQHRLSAGLPYPRRYQTARQVHGIEGRLESKGRSISTLTSSAHLS